MNLVAARLNRGLSTREAAERIGISQDVLLRAEGGESTPYPRHAKKIADFYGVQVTDIWPVEPTPAEAAA